MTARRSTTPRASAPFLLEGAWYAFEQSGRLLNDAVTLFDGGSHSTAAGIALLGREELGKGRILLDRVEACVGSSDNIAHGDEIVVQRLFEGP